MTRIYQKERLFTILTFVLLITGIIFFFLLPGYNEHSITELGTPKSIWVVPEKADNNYMMIKVDGLSTDDYGLKLDMYSRKDTLNDQFRISHSEIIKIPAGEIHAEFKREFHGDPSSAKANVTYLPQRSSGVEGNIMLQTGIF